ncbi:NADH-quinone oxidoreductase subunit G [Angustibacter sp. Root456]|uniref:NADH-quinone oxidoreductase subunit G n=1 Tax=Angustibacter sp. Root456 TaxID=1736539 RepID=UPI0006FACE3E|nr:NADH-quinone oxidoreductase subunit G [Angustibacter sp. Root456]KQX66154.1 NADH-quinone oxidoreductase subunit G [Angustibacter sp. Root456]
MTTTTSVTTPSGGDAAKRDDLVSMVIDGATVEVPKGTLVIRAAEQVGVQIPRFCDHPLLEPVGACRQCLVEVSTPGPDGSLRAMPKPQASCTLAVSEGMVVKTQRTSPVADKAQHGVMEFLLINHPLDCPVCDKGGECPLQNQALSNGRPETRFDDVKRTYPKPINISSQVLLDRDRCVLCARCTRFSKQIAGDPFIELVERSALQQVGIYAKQPFESYFSGNTVQICPVGALTGAAYRFRARPFDLVSVPSVCEHCASGCGLRTDHRRGVVLRRLADNDPQVNEEWNCDKGRWAFQYATLDRLTHPLVRDTDTGELRVASWPEALSVAAEGLRAARAAGGVGVLTGGRVTHEDAYAYAKFARVVLGTNDVDFRARPQSAEEAEFLAHAVAGAWVGAEGVSYDQLEQAPAVLLVGLEPEEESPIVFLRLRKAVRAHRQQVVSIASWATRGLEKLDGRLIPAGPGTEAEVLDALAEGLAEVEDTTQLLRAEGAVVLVGERLSQTPGALSAVLRLAEATGARIAWVPRRAGERGAVEAGALPNLLPGGRPVGDAAARVDLAAAWAVDGLPEQPGRDTAAMLEAARSGELGGLVVGGVEPADLADPVAAVEALDAAGFVVSLELRPSAVTERADVVLPVAAVAEKGGTFWTWEGRERPFGIALETNALSDYRVLDLLADELDVPLGLRDLASVRAQAAEIAVWDGERAAAPSVPAAEPPAVGPNQAVLSTWHLLLDAGRLQDGEPWLAGTARRPVVRLSAATAAEVGVAEGDLVTVSTERGQLTLPLVVTDMPERAVWLPTNQTGYPVRTLLGADSGSVVTLSRGGAA